MTKRNDERRRRAKWIQQTIKGAVANATSEVHDEFFDRSTGECAACDGTASHMVPITITIWVCQKCASGELCKC